MRPNIKNLIQSASKMLKVAGIDTYLLDSQLLLGHALNKDRSFIICNPQFEPNIDQVELFHKAIVRRREREPLSHIVGYREFYSRNFYVTKDVLDPRPDTELLIDIVKQNYNKTQEFNVLDIGTGSGAIIITILKEFNKSNGLALDINQKSLEIAQKNAILNKTGNRLKFLHSDLFKNLPKNIKFDLIISNPPYIPSKTIENLEKEVAVYEPKIALDGGIDGLSFYHEIIKNAPKYLKNRGNLLFEIGFDQKNAVLSIFKENNYKHLEAFKDLADNDRAILAKL